MSAAAQEGGVGLDVIFRSPASDAWRDAPLVSNDAAGWAVVALISVAALLCARWLCATYLRD